MFLQVVTQNLYSLPRSRLSIQMAGGGSHDCVLKAVKHNWDAKQLHFLTPFVLLALGNPSDFCLAQPLFLAGCQNSASLLSLSLGLSLSFGFGFGFEWLIGAQLQAEPLILAESSAIMASRFSYMGLVFWSRFQMEFS